MQILVTGGTGFIGGHLIRTLRAEHEVSCLTRQPRPDAALDGIRCIVADLNTEGWEESLPEQMDVVIHLAQANAPFPGSADELFRVNVLSTQRLADYARRAGVSRFVYASSGSVYAPSAELLSET
ncbi:MAG: NAD(P)-dependent oxidoreductase, partial [Nitrospira sp.]